MGIWKYIWRRNKELWEFQSNYFQLKEKNSQLNVLRILLFFEILLLWNNKMSRILTKKLAKKLEAQKHRWLEKLEKDVQTMACTLVINSIAILKRYLLFN